MAEKSRILVVDDEEALRYLLSSELAAEGYEVETAGDGDEAIESIKQKDYDVVLLDIKMPRVDGFEVLRFIKQNKPEIKVIMLTAYADVKNAIEALKLGASDFVSKPYDLEDILTSINRALGR
ncbi:Response regulator receiver domain-containing protein [Candidatus Kryptonium thompsonii]|jgi:DNA-binding NtrC family response regulator|uniref:Response regulator receiver domain-containing protein n=1 Tax=Candidatus Kryptonium thompsonii TaxID=1633631 RepID=A0A0N7MNI5_9BACT|nr:response regulator [Candidatus Kryptonium thompsoni]CUS76339.1 Response regulator receiver domain-containing protein [Candidatus Kryptonium thompsoni]CUS79444.1 Response regulator receiver domain-containing protein [Candidatus Kryptonium thompsoni]CUS83052.1 Response regulator receiver domain-containing protein [Candidatus Kryptonium thompsoni]CUS84875.1 Response regulator receiver domain-containing protein [Candidatus Kryptonium thompsoni]CUS86798.1 Response regulator receiver domain-conta